LRRRPDASNLRTLFSRFVSLLDLIFLLLLSSYSQ